MLMPPTIAAHLKMAMAEQPRSKRYKGSVYTIRPWGLPHLMTFEGWVDRPHYMVFNKSHGGTETFVDATVTLRSPLSQKNAYVTGARFSREEWFRMVRRDNAVLRDLLEKTVRKVNTTLYLGDVQWLRET